MTDTADDWHTVVDKKKEKRRHPRVLSEATCLRLERSLNTRNLSKCLMSTEARSLMADGYKFISVIPESGTYDAVDPRDDVKMLSIDNKWKDQAVFSKPYE